MKCGQIEMTALRGRTCPTLSLNRGRAIASLLCRLSIPKTRSTHIQTILMRYLKYCATILLPGSILFAQPALPPGLGDPPLPSGLKEEASESPELPPGLRLPSKPENDDPIGKTKPSINISGSLEMRAGARLQKDPVSDNGTLGEIRLQLQNRGSMGDWNYRLTSDLLYDAEAESQSIDFRSGTGWLDLREATLGGQLNDHLDLKLGRQTVTWGTGDLLFINDLFPKDWQSFLLGRDEEYLKAPGNSARINIFSDVINLDAVVSPRFDPDRFITGERLSYFDSGSGELVGQNAIVNPKFETGSEFALRAHRLIGNAEVALYFYDGYWKSPAGQTMDGIPTFPKLQVTGASWRQPSLGGIAYSEIGHYTSKEDHNGTNSLIRNSETRWLLGYERELGQDLTGSFQYYAEQRSGHSAFVSQLPDGATAPDRTRHLLTMRLTKFAMMQNLQLSLFTFWSPSDRDGYLRPNILYKIDDNWSIGGGANLFFGKEQSTFFGQFENNTNGYLFGRYGF